jgi:hypothetical protein
VDNKQAVSQLLDFVRTKLQIHVGLDTPSDELTLQTAKELNLVVGKRGRDGGTFPTDKGLNTLGLDIASYRATETTVKAAKTRGSTTNNTSNATSATDVDSVDTSGSGSSTADTGDTTTHE